MKCQDLGSHMRHEQALRDYVNLSNDTTAVLMACFRAMAHAAYVPCVHA